MTDMTVYVSRLAANLLFLIRPAPPGEARDLQAERRCRFFAGLYGWAAVVGLVASSIGPVFLGVAGVGNLVGAGLSVASFWIAREGYATAAMIARHRLKHAAGESGEAA